MTLEELRTAAEEAAKAAADKVKAQVEMISLQATIDRANNPTLQAAVVNATVTEHTSNKLKQIEASCEAIVASMPVYNTKTRENRKWNPRREYGLGLHIQALSGILSGILYSTTVHKQQLLVLLPGISEDIIESTLEAFGQTSYFSKNYGTIVPEVPANLVKLQANIQIIEQALNLNIDMSKLTQNAIDAKFELARLKAAKDAVDEQEALALQTQKIQINK